MKTEAILAAAKAAPEKQNLEDYREAVVTLRGKGYTWREIADFLTERGVSTDHTRVYRLFGEQVSDSRLKIWDVSVTQVVFLGEKSNRKRKTWNVMELILTTRSGQSLKLRGFAWGADETRYRVRRDQSLEIRQSTLVTKSKEKGFPQAFIKAEFKLEDGSWRAQEVYVVPEWEDLL